jgi:hypothetical protein
MQRNSLVKDYDYLFREGVDFEHFTASLQDWRSEDHFEYHFDKVSISTEDLFALKTNSTYNLELRRLQSGVASTLIHISWPSVSSN